MTTEIYGYHTTHIERGQFGKSSKIMEEVHELIDAEQQGVKIMALVELSDLYGAMKGYLAENFPDTTMDDLARMSEVTGRAFRNGARTSRD